MIEYKGDAVQMLKDNMSESQIVLFHQVNCKGRMGSGIAKQIREEFNNHYLDYVTKCDDFFGDDSEKLLGDYVASSVNPGSLVVGVFSQNNYGNNGSLYTNYEAIEKAFDKFFKDCPSSFLNTTSFIVPKYYGCGLGGGDWDVVSEIFKKLEFKNKIAIHCVEYKK